MLPLKAICRVSWQEAKQVVQSRSVEGAGVDQVADALGLDLQAPESIPGQLAETSQACSSRAAPLPLANGPVSDSEKPDFCPTPENFPAHLTDLFNMIRVHYGCRFHQAKKTLLESWASTMACSIFFIGVGAGRGDLDSFHS